MLLRSTHTKPSTCTRTLLIALVVTAAIRAQEGLSTWHHYIGDDSCHAMKSLPIPSCQLAKPHAPRFRSQLMKEVADQRYIAGAAK